MSTSIDELFRASSSNNKRKLEPLRDPNKAYKSPRLNGSDTRLARVANGGGDDIEAGPAPPSEDDQGDHGPLVPPEDDGDDEEGGRFFGGGVSAQEVQVLDYLDDSDDTSLLAPEKMDGAWLRRTALTFEKKISRNAELRARFESDPSKFIASEAELDAEIKRLSILSEHSDLYSEFARLGCVGSLVGLLAHENTDIAIDAIEIIDELTDEDVAAEDAQWDALVEALLEADLLSLLVSNLERFDETQETDRDGVYHALGIVENLCGRTATAERVAELEGLLKWLLRRIQIKDAGGGSSGVSQNRQYAAEILAILVQTSSKNRRRLASLDAIDIMLQLVAPYRKRDPEKGGEEEEYVEDLFEVLTCLADEPEGKTRFVEAEGVELCLIMVKEGKHVSRSASLRLLDHAAVGRGGLARQHVCHKIVEAGGLKNIFTFFMKTSKGIISRNSADENRTAEHLIGLFASMLRLLPGDSAERIRLLAKFVERDYEKTARLVSLRRTYAARVRAADDGIRAERAQTREEEVEEMEDEWFSRRLDAGFFCLQTLDVVLAWLVAEDAGAATTIRKLFADRDETLDLLGSTIREQLEGMDADAEDEEARETLEMLETLVKFLG